MTGRDKTHIRIQLILIAEPMNIMNLGQDYHGRD